MSGLFGTLSVAYSGLRHSQIGMDIAGQNIANVDTDGYSRRRAEAVTIGAVFPGRWARTEVGLLGVRTVSTLRLSDPFAENRVRIEMAKQSFMATRTGSLQQLEAVLREPGESGLTAQLSQLRAAWSDLALSPNNTALKQNVLSRAGTVANTLTATVAQYDAAAEAHRGEADALATQVTGWAGELAEVNRALAGLRNTQTDPSTLLDKRDSLVRQIVAATGGTATANPEGGMDVTVSGTSLVAGFAAGSLRVASGGPGADPGEILEFEVTDPDGASTPVSGLGGELGGHADMINVTIPDLMFKLDEFATTFADAVNAHHTNSFDADGIGGGDFFTYDPGAAARSFAVAITDPAEVATNSDAAVFDGAGADAIADDRTGEDIWSTFVISLGGTVAGAEASLATQSAFANQAVGVADSIAGVNLDEEFLSLTQYQRSYEAAARVITVTDSLLDTLINRTGLLR